MKNRIMRTNSSGIFFAIAAIGFGLLIGTAVPAHAEFRFVTGFDFTSGDYGASEDT